MRVDVLGVSFDNLTLDEAVDKAVRLLEEDRPHMMATANPEMIQKAAKDPQFAKVLHDADLVIPDGIGVIYAARILGRPLKSRVPGVDFAAKLMDYMAANGKRLYLLGAKPGVAEDAAKSLQAQHPGLLICGTHDGYFQEDAPVIAAIREAKADVVFVCLGFPRQEKWAAAHGAETGARLLIGLGGSLDVFAGRVQRAPEIMQKLGLEWLFRLYQEPSRIGRMARLPLILFQAAGARIQGK